MKYETIKEVPEFKRGKHASPEYDAIASQIKAGNCLKFDLTTVNRTSLAVSLKSRGVTVATMKKGNDLYVKLRA